MKVPSWLPRLLSRTWVQHIIVAVKRFSERLGWQFAAALTYFSFLAVVPIIMVGFSVAGFLLYSHPSWLDQLRDLVSEQFPASMADPINTALDQAVGSRLPIGIIGLIIAVYSGQSWMGNVRSALQAQWRPDFDDEQEIAAEPLWHYYLKNLRYLATLTLGMVASVVLTTVGSSLPHNILDWLGLPEYRILTVAFTTLPILLAVLTDTVLFFWIYWYLSPRKAPVPRKYVVRGAFVAAIGFEVLKILVTKFGSLILDSATGKIFGSVIGLMLFFYVIALILLFIAAWIATSPGAPEPPERIPAIPELPAPVAVQLGRESQVTSFSAGLVLGFLLRGRRRR